MRVWFGLLILISLVSPAQAGSFVEFFFPMLRPDPVDVSRTMEAPFADRAAIEEQEAQIEQGLPVNDVPLELAHRSAMQIGVWLKASLPGIMSFEAGSQVPVFEDARASFSGTGWQDFQTFLTNSKIRKVNEAGRYRVHTIVQETPLLLNKGAVGAYYFWAYKVPVMVSYLDWNMQDYRNAQEPVVQEFMATVQIRRAARSGNEHDIVIERFSVKAK